MKTTFGLPKKREEVMNMLQQAYVDQNLEDDEYENRVSRAVQAKSVEELQTIIDDFPNRPQLLSGPSPQHPPARQYQQAHGSGKVAMPMGGARQLTSFLGEQKISLSEVLKRPIRIASYLANQQISLKDAAIEGNNMLLSVENGLAETVIDLRSVHFEGKHIQVNITNFLGEVRVMLPKGVQVDNQVSVILGETAQRKRGVNWLKRIIRGQKELPSTPIPFSVALYGTCILGNITFVYD